jgi:hypothetical protein
MSYTERADHDYSELIQAYSPDFQHQHCESPDENIRIHVFPKPVTTSPSSISKSGQFVIDLTVESDPESEDICVYPDDEFSRAIEVTNQVQDKLSSMFNTTRPVHSKRFVASSSTFSFTPYVAQRQDTVAFPNSISDSDTEVDLRIRNKPSSWVDLSCEIQDSIQFAHFWQLRAKRICIRFDVSKGQEIVPIPAVVDCTIFSFFYSEFDFDLRWNSFIQSLQFRPQVRPTLKIESNSINFQNSLRSLNF